MNSNQYYRGIRHFNAGEFYDAHEVWEDVWRESQGLERQFLQGLIQTAVALHHYSTGNVAGARSLLERGRRNLEACPDPFGGIMLRQLLQSLAQWQDVLRTAGIPPSPPVITPTPTSPMIDQ